jgi:hypothetical protein
MADPAARATRDTKRGLSVRFALLGCTLWLLGHTDDWLEHTDDQVQLPMAIGLMALVFSLAITLLIPVFVGNFLCDRYDRWRESRTRTPAERS